MGRLMTAMATVMVALAITAATASASDVPCSKLSAGKYQCSFYPAGNTISAGAPVQDATGTRVGYLNHGANWIVCQASGATVHSGANYNRWWGYTEANDQHFGWVNAVWASGGSNDGPFAKAPNCGSTYGSPPTAAAPAPAPTPAPTPTPPPTPTPTPSPSPSPKPVPCHSIGAGKHQCFFYTAGDGIHGGTPVFGSKRVGYLNHGNNDFEACAGATTSSVLHDQVEGNHVGGLSTSTGVVTLSVGGNDADFIGILGRCLVVKSWCENQLRKERAVIRNQLPGRLDTLYTAIKHAAPHAKVIVLGYPYIFGSCAKGGGVSLLHGATDLLDDTIRAATQRNHVYFVDPRAAFTGHSECDKDAWINHVYGGELQVSFHPNEAGWSEDAQLIEKLLWRIGW